MSRRGVSTTEYALLVAVLIVAIVACAYLMRGGFNQGVRELGDDVQVLLGGEGNAATPSRTSSGTECPYTFDPRTGRYHDESDGGYLMVSFNDAAAAGCS